MAESVPKQSTPASTKNEKGSLKTGETEKEKDVRRSNIIAAKAVADAVRTSLGPKGMDKMIVSPGNEVIITNDGATILKKMEVLHPCAKMVFYFFLSLKNLFLKKMKFSS